MELASEKRPRIQTIWFLEYTEPRRDETEPLMQVIPLAQLVRETTPDHPNQRDTAQSWTRGKLRLDLPDVYVPLGSTAVLVEVQLGRGAVSRTEIRLPYGTAGKKSSVPYEVLR